MIAYDPAVTYRIEDLARDAFVSPDHFRRLFKERTGITPKAWIIRCRIQKAKGLLLGSDYTIERIAELCGFQNVFFFSRQFKEKAGIPPSVYRA